VSRRVIVGLTAVVLAALLPGCGLAGGGDTYTLTAHFPRAVSVFPSSDVRVLGLPAGSVKTVEVEGDQVLVELAIPSDIKVPKGAKAQIVPQSLIGERYIQLSPAYKDGMDTMRDGEEITDTIVPVEPDEALAALKEFLDSLDPEGIGRLVTNLDDDLHGNGAALNDTLGSLSQLVETFAAKDDVLLRIVDSFDRLTETLVTRESQLGEVLDAFAEASQVLADERESIGDLVGGLADLSQTGLRLVGEHSTALRTDIQTLADAAATIDANLSSVTQLLRAGNLLTTGLLGAYNPAVRGIDLRNDFSPLVEDIVGLVVGVLGAPACAILPLPPPLCPEIAALGAEPTPAQIVTKSTTPIGSLLTLLSQPTAPIAAAPSTIDGIGDFVSDATATLLGVGE
jgi:virulence factor Mce-like protein